MARRYRLFLILYAVLFLSGCATVSRPVPVTMPPGQAMPPAPLGTIQNPIIDSNITLAEALRKPAPQRLKERQCIIDVLYYSFDGSIHKGQIVADRRLEDDIRQAFNVIFATRFPVASAIPVSHDKFYNNGEFNSDGESMKCNNTSGFNYRLATGSKKLSMHSYGFAIDINPVQNPYIKKRIRYPAGAVYNPSAPGTLTRSCPVVKAFKKLGWVWGGDWKTLKDYQHFEIALPD